MSNGRKGKSPIVAEEVEMVFKAVPSEFVFECLVRTYRYVSVDEPCGGDLRYHFLGRHCVEDVVVGIV